jgi:mediator of RNA polymerase II transcription subunit 12
MTSRPTASQRQPPHRPLTSATLLQRPPLPPFPSRRNHDAASRLQLDLSKDSKKPGLVDTTSPAKPTWKPSIPPRGRPKLHFDVPSVRNVGRAQEGGPHGPPIKPMPLPARPGQRAPPALDKARSVQGNSAKKDARLKPYVLEVPAAAPRYSPNGMSNPSSLETHLLT